jgi:hypothetical protein
MARIDRTVLWEQEAASSNLAIPTETTGARHAGLAESVFMAT